MTLAIVLLSSGIKVYGSPADSNSVNKKRLSFVIAGESVLYASSLYFLNNLWYKDYPRSAFHFFNDNNEWLQMDKIGHAATSATIGLYGYKTLKWCGVSENKSIWYGGSLGFAYLTTIEILDGFSAEWGASSGDLLANTFGSMLFMGQQFAWQEQRVNLKWSFHTTKYSQYRPDLLGNSLNEKMLKDYNGQTYWLSVNIKSFLKNDKHFPKWLNIAFGYGAEGMTGSFENVIAYNGNQVPPFKRYRQYYLSPDVDFTRIPTKSSFLKVVFHALNFVKLPTPAIEYSRDKGFRLFPLYF